MKLGKTAGFLGFSAKKLGFPLGFLLVLDEIYECFS